MATPTKKASKKSVKKPTKKPTKKSVRKPVKKSAKQPAKKPSSTAAVKASTRHRISRHYYAYMPDKKHHRVLVWVVFFAVVIVMAAQLLYPPDRAVPFAKLGDQYVGWSTDLALAETINQTFSEAELELTAQGMVLGKAPLAHTGAEPRTDVMVRDLTEYPFWQRFIPGSILWQHPVSEQWVVQYNPAQLVLFSDEQAANLSTGPVNASLSIKDGQVVAVDDAPGTLVHSESLASRLGQVELAYGSKVSVVIEAAFTPPQKTAESLASVRADAELALARPLRIQAGGHMFTPNAEQKATWLRLDEDEAGQTVLRTNTEAMERYVHEVISAEAGKPRGTTAVALENGREVRRQPGEPGVEVAFEPLELLLSRYLLQGLGGPLFIAEMVEVPPQIVYNNRYTATQAGLQAYIDDKAKQGAWISVQQLDGNGWAAGANDHQSVVSASTYKLYVSMYLFKEMQEQKRDWSTPILGTSTSVCFDRMTIASTNPCAQEWLKQFGRGTVNEFLYNHGFSRATTFTHPQATHTSAADLTRFMVGLEQGTFVDGPYRERLLRSLSVHSFRSGVPAGSAGRVWNKVGFLWDYTNDTAIVHHPRGKYVITILTKGQSYASIANMTREIEKIMYP